MEGDLWGDVPAGEKMQTPISILREQAGILSRKTNDELQGEIIVGKNDTEFTAKLRIIVPALNNFTVDILRITYPIGLYPVNIKPLVSGLIPHDAEDDAEYNEYLASYFQSDEVRTIIKRLRTQIASID
jgi:hypothetical protein